MAHPKLRILEKTLFAFSSLTMSLYFIHNVHEFYKLYAVGGYFITFNKTHTKLNITDNTVANKHRFVLDRVEDLAYNYSINDCCRDNNNYRWLLNNVYDAFIMKHHHLNNDNAVHHIIFNDNQDDDFIKGLLEPNVDSRRNSNLLDDSNDESSPVIEGNSNSVPSQKYYSVYDLNNKHYKKIDNLDTHFFGGWRGRTLITLSAFASIGNTAYGLTNIFSGKFNAQFKHIFDPKLKYALLASSLALAIVCFEIKNPRVRAKLLGEKDYFQYDQLTGEEMKFIIDGSNLEVNFRYNISKLSNQSLLENPENPNLTCTYNEWVRLLNNAPQNNHQITI